MRLGACAAALRQREPTLEGHKPLRRPSQTRPRVELSSLRRPGPTERGRASGMQKSLALDHIRTPERPGAAPRVRDPATAPACAHCSSGLSVERLRLLSDRRPLGPCFFPLLTL